MCLLKCFLVFALLLCLRKPCLIKGKIILPLGVNDERLDRGIRSVTFLRCYLKFAQKNLSEFCAAFLHLTHIWMSLWLYHKRSQRRWQEFCSKHADACMFTSFNLLPLAIIHVFRKKFIVSFVHILFRWSEMIILFLYIKERSWSQS